MKLRPTPSCRLQILLARDAPVGTIFRRGPTQWVQLIKWNTKKDTFEEGQWFHGHIYVGRSDLSPAGSLLIYFASKFNKKTIADKDYTYAWTAISKPPYLTALALWPKGDCWHGGGLFTGSHDVFLNHRPAAATPHRKHLPKGVRVSPNPLAAGEDGPILGPRMERDGWKFIQDLEYDYSKQRTIKPTVMEKLNRKGNLKLRVEIYFDDVERWLCSCSFTNRPRKKFLLGVGTWADFDQQGRLLIASEGKLSCVILKKDKVSLSVLADFNASKPTALRPPAWATRW